MLTPFEFTLKSNNSILVDQDRDLEKKASSNKKSSTDDENDLLTDFSFSAIYSSFVSNHPNNSKKERKINKDKFLYDSNIIQKKRFISNDKIKIKDKEIFDFNFHNLNVKLYKTPRTRSLFTNNNESVKSLNKNRRASGSDICVNRYFNSTSNLTSNERPYLFKSDDSYCINSNFFSRGYIIPYKSYDRNKDCKKPTDYSIFNSRTNLSEFQLNNQKKHCNVEASEKKYDESTTKSYTLFDSISNNCSNFFSPSIDVIHKSKKKWDFLSFDEASYFNKNLKNFSEINLKSNHSRPLTKSKRSLSFQINSSIDDFSNDKITSSNSNSNIISSTPKTQKDKTNKTLPKFENTSFNYAFYKNSTTFNELFRKNNKHNNAITNKKKLNVNINLFGKNIKTLKKNFKKKNISKLRLTKKIKNDCDNENKINCDKCGDFIVGEFLKALNQIYHVYCLKCYQCNKRITKKFFLYELHDKKQDKKSQIPLCEYDYFKILNLLCFVCNSPIRNDYILAFGNKYHINHFKCEFCDKVFDINENYYEKEKKVYCHYHYSKLFAYLCNGCNSPIFKKYIEVNENNNDYKWHIECYMVYKYWNICIGFQEIGLKDTKLDDDTSSIVLDSKLHLLSNQKKLKSKITNCWIFLSKFEEGSAILISDMLIYACNMNWKNLLFSTSKLIMLIDNLFNALDKVFDFSILTSYKHDNNKTIQNSNESFFFITFKEQYELVKKHSKVTTDKIIEYLSLFFKSKESSSQDVLPLNLLLVINDIVTNLKIVIKYGLSESLKINKFLNNSNSLDYFIKTIIESQKIIDFQKTDNTDYNFILCITLPVSETCHFCFQIINSLCIRFEKNLSHFHCFNCFKCQRLIDKNEIHKATFNHNNKLLLCGDCNTKSSYTKFEIMTDLSLYVYLTKISFLRLKTDFYEFLDSDLNYTEVKKCFDYDSNLSSSLTDWKQNKKKFNYINLINEITNFRLKKLDKTFLNSKKKNVLSYVSSVDSSLKQKIVDENKSSVHFSDKKKQSPVKNLLNIIDNLNESFVDDTFDFLKKGNSLFLDDIYKIIVTEQAREQRPNAFKHHNNLYQKQKITKSTLSNEVVNSTNLSCMQTLSVSSKMNPKFNDFFVLDSYKPKYYCELTKNEHFLLRHLAIKALLMIDNENFNKEELLNIIQVKKQSNFWEKIKLYGSSNIKKKKISVFGVDLYKLTKEYGIYSNLALGPKKVKIPIVINDIINALKQKDLSVEGIFRLNSNIKKLKELADQINKNPLKSPDFKNESAVQLAALMKKWLRELPIPLLTFDFYNLWIFSQQHKNPKIRNRILLLCYCLLPRSHRSLADVLMKFFFWVSSFAEVNQDCGSKMDIHNLATVLAPNILYSKKINNSESQSGDTHFLAIEVVNQLIEFHENICIIPSDMLYCFDKCKFTNYNDEMLNSREIMIKIDETIKKNPEIIGFMTFDTNS